MQTLKYLFTAQYKDGSVFSQNAEDASTIDPLRSAFYDLLKLEKPVFEMKDGAEVVTGYGNPLVKFGLMESGNVICSVDLLDGSFEVDNRKFFMHDGNIKNFRLVYFRRNQQHINQDIKDGQFVGEPRPAGHNIAFHFGWQGKDENGKTVQRVMIIN